jgi:hypothetical protein
MIFKSKPFEEFFFKIKTTSRVAIPKKFIHYGILKLGRKKKCKINSCARTNLKIVLCDIQNNSEVLEISQNNNLVIVVKFCQNN